MTVLFKLVTRWIPAWLVLIAAAGAAGAQPLQSWNDGGRWWCGNVNWGNNNINNDIDIDINKRNNCIHNLEHRDGVRYKKAAPVKTKFSYEQAWKICVAQLRKDLPMQTSNQNERFLRGGACMARFGYRF